MAEELRSFRYLSLLERPRIATLRERGLGVREIARRIGRAPSTGLPRELRRNMGSHDKNVYDADLAHARARDKARRERAGALVRDPQLRDLVRAKLEKTWSPQQVASWLRAEHPDQPEWHFCHETIYQALCLGRKGGLHQEVFDASDASTDCLPERRRLGSRRPVVEAHPGVFGRSVMNHVPRRRRVESRVADPGDFTGASGVASRTSSTPQ